MSTSIVIRPVAETDLDRLDGAYPEPGRPTSRHRDRWDLQERGEGVYLVCWDANTPIGWVFVCRPGSREASEQAQRLDCAEVLDLHVDQQFRGQGHGSSLLAAAERLAHDAGWQLIGLEVTVANPHNDVARAMYERYGYRESGLGVFQSGYFYWTESGQRRWDGEPHRFLIKPIVGRGRQRPREVNRVVPYDPSWPDLFQAIRRRVAPALGDINASVEHVGSTAVPGLVAKPIVDIDVVLEDATELPDAIDRLGALGYVHQGDLGVVGREAFDAPRALPYHHLYIVVDGSTPHQDHILLRDYLRQHPEAAARYAARKLEIAHLITDGSRQAYLEAKASIVEELLARAREWHPGTSSV